MAEEKKHWVCVHKDAVQHYLDRGYQVEAQSALDYMRSTPVCATVNPEVLKQTFANHCMMTIGADEHKRVTDTHPKKYRMYTGGEVSFWESVSVASVRVLEETPDGGAFVAREDRDARPELVGAHDLFDTPGACIADKREFLQQKIAHVREALGRVETFLKHTENLA